MTNTGERYIPGETAAFDAIVNVERYFFAMDFAIDKTVCDIGCGCGLGSYLYSLVAKKVYAVDYSQEAIDYAKWYPFNEKTKFIKQDLEKVYELPEVDVIIAIEFLEHLKDPTAFLKAQTAKELVFSFPFNALITSTWHKADIMGEIDVRNILVNAGYSISNIAVQKEKWLYGHAVKL